MLFANDYNDIRVHIDETHSNQSYYCPFCGVPMITKKGDIRQHHFAHSAKHPCSDSWERNGSYDMSQWHNDWQSLFPKVNQEIKLSLGETKHRADVLIDRTVIEFQHSIMPATAFDNRNNFYFNLGYKVVWLFDLSDIYGAGALIYRKENGKLIFSWQNPKRAFNSYDVKSGCIDLFFQLSETEDNRIIRILDVSEDGFESFTASPFMSKSDFLSYVGLHNGLCTVPFRDDIEKNKQYKDFCHKHSITLNKQQERAVQAVEGANLLLAVPGSGKTTVLVARLGHMVINKGIDPGSILAITYNKKASLEMEARFHNKFGTNIGTAINFSTINALSLSIYKRYCRKCKIKERTQLKEDDRRKIIVSVLKEFSEEYPSENEILELGQAITYIKNMMLENGEVLEMEQDIPNLSVMFHSYQEKLKADKKMDFDDQMVYARYVLEHDQELLSYYRSKYKYISVDEAQDTSKIQHLIIKLIATGNNLFMVGDEDQSIYGFRAAYPKALLNFRYDYTNPFIMRMEHNYRATEQIVEKAQLFISQNKGRYEKHMTAERGSGEAVNLITVNNREEQYLSLLEIARKHNGETAFLYRDNESSVVLVDLLLRNNIAFSLRAPEMNFFGARVIVDILAFLKLSVNAHDYEAFDRVCNKGILYLKKQQISYVDKDCNHKKISVFDALEKQMQYVEIKYRDRASIFKSFEESLSSMSPLKAVECILEKGYQKYIEQKHLDSGKIDILKMIAKNENDVPSFLKRLQYLEAQIQNGFHSKEENPIMLSTIHSSKGLEYDTVFMVDVYDGRFPSSRPNIFSRSKDNADGEQEERRLFYVGITRAKNHLNLFNICDRESSFVEELFPEVKAKHEEELHRRITAERARKYEVILRQQEKERQRRKKEVEERKKEAEERQKAEEEKWAQRQKEEKEEQERRKKVEDANCKEEVLKIIDQQEYQARDHLGRRWVRCEKCGEVKQDKDFSSYGGEKRINIGICSNCCGGYHRKVSN